MVAVLGMGSAAGEYHQADAPGYNGPLIGAAYSTAGGLLVGLYAAGSHHAEAAAYSLVSELALGLLGQHPVKGCNYSIFSGYLNHFKNGWVDGSFIFYVRYLHQVMSYFYWQKLSKKWWGSLFCY